MIQLYDAKNAPITRTDYSMNGDVILTPTEAVYDTSTRILTLEHPIDEDGRYKHLTESAVIKAPSYNGEQLFRIFDTDKTETSVSVEARPIFYDAKSEFLFDNRPTGKNGQQAVDWILGGTRYSGKSDIETVSTSYYENKNVIEALLSDDENSFINRWGGEVEFNNFTININKRNGKDNGAVVQYGRNITSIKETVNTEDVVYHIRPFSYNGYTLPNNELVSSPKSFPVVGKTIVKKYEDIKLEADLFDGEDITNITVCKTMEDVYKALRQRAAAEFTANINEPKTTIKINLASLRYDPEYQNYTQLENIKLGDGVILQHPLFKNTNARVNSLKYDCLNNSISEAVIGNAEFNYIQTQVQKETKIYQLIDTDTNTVTAKETTSDTYSTTDENGNKVSGISGSGWGVKYIAFDNGLVTEFQEGSSGGGGGSGILWGTQDPETALANAENGTVYIQV